MSDLATARAAYESDLWIDRLTALSPPASRDHRSGIISEEPASRMGRTLSGSLLRYLGHPEGYGAAHPFVRALHQLGRDCHAQHLGHDARPAWRGSLCRQLVRLTVIHRLSPRSTAMVLEVGPDRTERLLKRALGEVLAIMDRRRDDAEHRERAEFNHLVPR